MPNNNNQNLGKIVSVYPISPAYLQKSLIVIIFSFMFFLAMLVAFSVRQQIGYFIISTAFLIVQLFTLFGFLKQRKQQLKIYENGFSYKEFSTLWEDIEIIEKSKSGKFSVSIQKRGGDKISFSENIHNPREAVEKIKDYMQKYAYLRR